MPFWSMVGTSLMFISSHRVIWSYYCWPLACSAAWWWAWTRCTSKRSNLKKPLWTRSSSPQAFCLAWWDIAYLRWWAWKQCWARRNTGHDVVTLPYSCNAPVYEPSFLPWKPTLPLHQQRQRKKSKGWWVNLSSIGIERWLMSYDSLITQVKLTRSIFLFIISHKKTSGKSRDCDERNGGDERGSSPNRETCNALPSTLHSSHLYFYNDSYNMGSFIAASQ